MTRSDLFNLHIQSMVALSTEEETELTEVFETDNCQVMDAGAAILGHPNL